MRRVRADEACIDPEALERLTYIQAEAVVPDLRDDRGPVTEARGGNGHVRRAAAERLRERLDLRERNADLLGVEIDADATDGDQFEVRHERSRR